MSAQKHHHTFAVVLLVCVALLFGLLIFSYYNPNYPLNPASKLSQQTSNKGNTYKSDFLNITFSVPEGFQAEENYTNIVLTSSEGSISINKTSTNFSTLNEYLVYIQNMNNFTLDGVEELTIGEKLAISGMIGDEKITYIYPSRNVVYSVSTTSPDLYDELDQVAQSFRYTGNNTEED